MPCKSTRRRGWQERGQQGKCPGRGTNLAGLRSRQAEYPKGGDNPHIRQRVNAEKMRSIHTVGYHPAVKRCEVHD